MERLFREIMRDIPRAKDFRVQATAFQVAQEACEVFLTSLFIDCTYLATHAKRVTIVPKVILVQTCTYLAGHEIGTNATG